MRIYAVLGIILMLAGAVAYIDSAGATRAEAERLAKGLSTIARSAEQQARDSRVALNKVNTRASTYKAERDALRAQPPKVVIREADEPEWDGFCRAGCKLRWPE